MTTIAMTTTSFFENFETDNMMSSILKLVDSKQMATPHTKWVLKLRQLYRAAARS